MNARELNRRPAPDDADTASGWLDPAGTQALAVTFVADVISVAEDGSTMVRAGAQRWTAQRALSCLVEPLAGDRVACWRVADGEATAVFMVAVLTRQAPAAGIRLRLDAGTTIDAHDGALAFRVAHSLRIETASCELESERLSVRTGTASIVYRSLETLGEMCRATLGQLKLVGASLSTVFERETHHAQQHHRVVEGLDFIDAKVMHHRASELMHLQADNLLANGDRLVKVKGTQIHLG